MITHDALLQSPCFIKAVDDNSNSLPARIHALFPFGQPFLFDQADNITLHPSSTDWIICDANDVSKVRLVSYESFFDHYQPEDVNGWDYLGQFFANQPEETPGPTAPVAEQPADPDPTTEAAETTAIEFHADQYVMEERLLCECGSHTLSVYASGDMDGQIEIAFWRHTLRAYKPKWSIRLRQIWDILTKGHAFTDMVVLNRSEQAKLIKIIEQSHDLSERYEAARSAWLASRPTPKREVFTLQEVAELQANHEAEKQELLEIIETLSVKLQPQS